MMDHDTLSKRSVPDHMAYSHRPDDDQNAADNSLGVDSTVTSLGQLKVTKVLADGCNKVMTLVRTPSMEFC